MTYNTGTATDYIDFLDQLIEVVTGRHMDTAVINAGGTGHAVGDVLTIDNTGATQTETAKIEVTSVSGGVVDGIRIFRGGVYTVDATTTTGNAQSATTGSGISFTADISFAETGWTQLTRESEAASAVVAVAGSGYTNGSTDVLTLVGGVLAPGGVASTFTATVTGGTVDSAALLVAGDYEVFPSNPVATTVAPAGGTACTLTVTAADVSGDTIVVLQGDAGANIDPLVGIKTYSSETDQTGSNTVFNWALFGMTAWSSLAQLHEQANISPGFSTADNGDITTSTSGDGSFVPLKDSDAFDIDWEIRATGRAVTIMARVEGSSTVYISQCSFGLLNQFGVTTEVPFPAYVAGASDRKRVWYQDTAAIFGGLSEVIERNNGPMFAWSSAQGLWINCKNAQISSNLSTTPTYAAENDSPRAHVWPLGPSLQHSGDDIIWGPASAGGFDNDDLTLTVDPIAIYRTPDTGGDLFPLFPVVLVQADSSSGFYRTFGEIDGVWWFHIADSGAAALDRHEQGSIAYKIFQNGTRIQPFSFLALEEN